MVYMTRSIYQTLARVIRTARLSDLTYADDMLEWAREGMGRLMIRWRLDKLHKEIEIKNHTGDLPCGLVSLAAVRYQGRRLRKSTSSVDIRCLKWHDVKNDVNSYFLTDTTVQPEAVNSQNTILLRGLNIKELAQPLDTGDYYDLQYNKIKTSFKEGCITIYFTKQPVDKDGYPMIPDLEEAEAALFWYICAQLCFTGYKLPDPNMDFRYCDAKATEFFRKAKNIIKTQSEDEKESTVQLLNNLIPPSNYYNTLFVGGEQRKYVNK